MHEQMKKSFCVIGDPIAQSLSPEIHHFVFKQLGLNHEYQKIRVRPGELAKFIQDVREKGYAGFNVTVPHKEFIIPFLDEIDNLAKDIGAVNTVLNKKGGLIGYNTDVIGCRLALEKSGCYSPQKVIQLGCGGAARASLETVASMGAKEVILFDTCLERAEELRKDFQKMHPIKINIGTVDVSSFEQHFSQSDLLINATPVGMWPKDSVSPIPFTKLIPEGIFVLDMVYKPLETKLIKQAQAMSCKTISGIYMLIGQALTADEIWLCRKISDNMLDRVYHFLTRMEA